MSKAQLILASGCSNLHSRPDVIKCHNHTAPFQLTLLTALATTALLRRGHCQPRENLVSDSNVRQLLFAFTTAAVLPIFRNAYHGVSGDAHSCLYPS